MDEDHPLNVMKRKEARVCFVLCIHDKSMLECHPCCMQQLSTALILQAPKIVPGQPLDMNSFQQTQDQGKPKMIFASMKSSDQKENEKIFT